MHTILIAVTGILLGWLQLTEAANCEEFVSCMNKNALDEMKYGETLSLLHIDSLPEDTPKLCSQAAQDCFRHYYYPNSAECAKASASNRVWENRFQNPHYLWKMLSAVCLADDDLKGLQTLKKCYDEELKKNVLSCVAGTTYDTPCLYNRYNANNNCPDSADGLFSVLVGNLKTTYTPYGYTILMH